jgi:hypothetical protein
VEARELANMNDKYDLLLEESRDEFGESDYQELLQELADRSSQTTARNSKVDSTDTGYDARMEDAED